MDLATHQRKLLGMIKGAYTPAASDEEYLQRLEGSSGLSMVREIVAWWRAFGLERTCILTSRLLKRLGRFEEAVSTFLLRPGSSSQNKRNAVDFFEMLAEDGDGLVASLARFEAAMLRVKQGDSATYVIEWGHEPMAVIDSLLHSTSPDLAKVRGRWRTIVTRSEPELFRVEALN